MVRDSHHNIHMPSCTSAPTVPEVVGGETIVKNGAIPEAVALVADWHDVRVDHPDPFDAQVRPDIAA